MGARTRLPPPPADIHTRKLPLVTIKGNLYRINRSTDSWRYFGKNKSKRFDDPLGHYGVLYVAIQPDAAFAEVFLRQISLMVVAENDLWSRSLVTLSTSALKCVDLTGPGLRRLSCDNRISTEKPYHTVGLWSRAFYDHPQQPDGIVYRSRHNPKLTCLALFDRCDFRLLEENNQVLLGPERRAWTAAQLKKYNLCLVS